MIIMSRLSDKVSKCPVLMQFGAAAVILMVVGGSGYYTHYMMVVKPRIMAVGMAMEKYEAVLDAEPNDPNCQISHCPTSSKDIPGVPEDRALFTDAERLSLSSLVPGSQASYIRVYSVTPKENDMMEAIVYVMVSKCAYPETNQPYANSVDPHRMTLIPSSVNNDEYVVIEDQLLDQVSEGLPDSFNSRYSGGKTDPECSK